MDDFAKLMSEQGVRPLGEARATPAKSTRRGSPPRSSPPARAAAPPPPERAPEPEPAPTQKDGPSAPEPVAWDVGSGAVGTVQRALTRCMVQRGSITMLVRVAGSLTARVGRLHATVAELAAEADGAEAELVIIEGPGWKTIMHPASGVATLAENPTE